MKYVMKTLAEKTWILSKDGIRMGIVNEIDGEIHVFGRLEKKTYANLQDFKKSLSGPMIFEDLEVKTEKEQGNINGFPIRHDIFFNILTEPVPSYTKAEKSQMRYAAGYYTIRFPQGWTPGFCPKLSTLTEYEYMGPFTTKLEMQHAISSKNKEIHV